MKLKPLEVVVAAAGCLVAAMLLLILMNPWGGTPREFAYRLRSQENMHALGKAFLTYASDHDEAYPDSLNVLVSEKLVSPKCLVSPAQKRPGESYVYIKPPDKEPPNTTQVVMVYERLENFSNQGTNVLFMDGHVAWVRMEYFPELLAKSKAATQPAGRTEPPSRPGAASQPSPPGF